jgi:TfuA protein
MHADVVMFIGPSLPAGLRPQMVECRPPVRRGDLPRLIEQGPVPKHVAIVDGEFHQHLAVSPREILTLLKLGTTVYGSSSMGALRASELWTYGMVGVGRIFQMYRDGEIAADDEVALLYDPASEVAISEPLANIRCAVRRLVDEGSLTATCGGTLIDVAAALPYQERRYRTIARIASETLHVELEPIVTKLRSHDQKRLDALELCTLISRSQ